MRARILAILNERVASPNEIAEMIDERLPNVSYHVRALLDLGCIELVDTAQRRGAIEHYYRALRAPVLQRPRLEAAAALGPSGDFGRRPSRSSGRTSRQR